MSVEIDIEKTIGSFHLQTSFTGGNEAVALLGASGCGKSLTLKCIAGIEKPDKGRIVIDGVTLFDSKKKINLSPQERRTGFMFQNYALFPNMTVDENIRVGAMREKDKAKREKLINELIDSFGLNEVRKLYPRSLSGGQQQRTALARILVSDPRILLLDEPFSALDSHLRFRLEQEIRQVISSFGKSVVLVSHDRDEVFRLSDKIIVMGHGCVDMTGTREEVFARPQTVSAAALTGIKNITPCTVNSDSSVNIPGWGITIGSANTDIGVSFAAMRTSGIIYGDGENKIDCEVLEIMENPNSVSVTLKPAGGTETILWELDKNQWNTYKNSRVTVHIPTEQILYLKG